MDTTHATPELFAALAKAQGEVENATKNAQNPHFRNNYADLAEVLNTVRPVFSANGLSIAQQPSYNGSLASVTTILAHASGGFVVGVASCVPGKSDAQGIGAATTYLRRYSLAAMSGVAQEDDDGNAAAHNRKPAETFDAGAASWLDAIKDASTSEELERIGAALKEQASTINGTSMKAIRAAWANRAKAIKA